MAATPEKPTPPTFLGITIPSWVLALGVPLLVSAFFGYGASERIKAETHAQTAGQFRELKHQLDSVARIASANSAYIATQQAERQKRLDDYEEKRRNYAERMEMLLDKYEHAAPTPK